MVGIRVPEYLDSSGRSPWRRWFNDLDAIAAAKVATALYRLGQGNFSTVAGVGSGVYEAKIDFGPGYRIYFVGAQGLGRLQAAQKGRFLRAAMGIPPEFKQNRV